MALAIGVFVGFWVVFAVNSGMLWLLSHFFDITSVHGHFMALGSTATQMIVITLADHGDRVSKKAENPQFRKVFGVLKVPLHTANASPSRRLAGDPLGKPSRVAYPHPCLVGPLSERVRGTRTVVASSLHAARFIRRVNARAGNV